MWHISSIRDGKRRRDLVLVNALKKRVTSIAIGVVLTSSVPPNELLERSRRIRFCNIVQQ